MLPLLPFTKAVILACVGVFCLDVLVNGQLLLWLGLWPLHTHLFGVWQPLTYALLHGSFEHLFFNMLGLYMFGSPLERTLGQRRYAQLLLVGVLSAAVVQMVFTLATGSRSPTVGISGAVFGLLLVMGLLHGEEVVMPLIPPIPMKMKTLVVLYGSVELLLGVLGRTGIAHFAHLGGMIGAYALIQVWRHRARGKGSPRRTLH